MRKMKLRVINVYRDSYEFIYDDGNMFGDHLIVVTGDFDNGFESADLEG